MVCGLAGRVGPGVRESQPTGHRRPGCALRRNWRESCRMAKTTVAAGHPGPRGRVYREPRLGRKRKGQRLPLDALPQRRYRPGRGESTRRGRRDSRAQVPERVHGATSRAPFGAAFFFFRVLRKGGRGALLGGRFARDDAGLGWVVACIRRLKKKKEIQIQILIHAKRMDAAGGGAGADFVDVESLSGLPSALGGLNFGSWPGSYRPLVQGYSTITCQKIPWTHRALSWHCMHTRSRRLARDAQTRFHTTDRYHSRLSATTAVVSRLGL